VKFIMKGKSTVQENIENNSLEVCCRGKSAELAVKHVARTRRKNSVATMMQSAVVACVLLLLSAAAFASEVHTDYHRSTNFSRYHTYYWRSVQSDQPLWRERIRHAIDKELQAKGWREVPSGGQVALSAVGAVHDVRQYQTFDYGLGPGWWWGMDQESTTTEEKVPVGSLVVVMFDAGTHRLIWRGTATDTLSDKTRNNERKLTMIVDKMFRKFPPREKG
jgi:hypothetical protein